MMSHQMLNNNKNRNKETNRNCGIENTITEMKNSLEG